MVTALSLLGLYVAIGVLYAAWAVDAAARGVAAAWLVAGALVGLIALPALVATLSFALAWVFRTSRPPGRTLGPAASVRLWLGEVLAMAKSHPRMALGWWFMRDPPARPAPAPVLLLHGVLCNAGFWRAAIPRLEAAGCGPVYTLSYGPPTASNELFADQVAAKVAAIRAATGASRVALVGHSMGGVVARAYVRRHGGAHVHCLVTVGAPHHGSVHAWMFPGECLAQIRPGNAWLEALNAEQEGALPVRVVSVRSWHDSMVAPQASAQLGGADNVEFTGIGHNALIEDAGVLARIAEELRRVDARPAGGTAQ